LPVCGAEDAVVLLGFEGLEEAKRFEDGAADCDVVDGDLGGSVSFCGGVRGRRKGWSSLRV